MKVFLDANILVSVVNQEYPLFSLSSRILSLVDRKGYEIYTTPLCLAITFYFAAKKSGNKMALTKVKLLAEKLNIAALDQEAVRQAAADPRVEDFEDGMEYYSVMAHGCQIILTEDVGDFYFSEIPVQDCEAFIRETFAS